MMMYNDYYYNQKQDKTAQVVNVPYNTYEPISKVQQYYCQEQGNWDTMEIDSQEEECYAEYDLKMADAIAEADYQDFVYAQNERYQQKVYYDDLEEEYEEEEENYDCQSTKSSYDYQNDSLLSLVVGVQSYLTEQQDFNKGSAKCDSPLYSLQYKMYTYMRQRALELGVEL